MRTIVKTIILASAVISIQSCNFFGDKPADTIKDTATITTPQEESADPADTTADTASQAAPDTASAQPQSETK
jgi:hypothetical protein